MLNAAVFQSSGFKVWHHFCAILQSRLPRWRCLKCSRWMRYQNTWCSVMILFVCFSFFLYPFLLFSFTPLTLTLAQSSQSQTQRGFISLPSMNHPLPLKMLFFMFTGLATLETGDKSTSRRHEAGHLNSCCLYREGFPVNTRANLFTQWPFYAF